MKQHVAATHGWDEAAQRNRFAQHFNPDPAVVSVILVEERLAGALRLEDRGDEIYISVLQVVPALQGRGLGTAVIRSILDRARLKRRSVALRVFKVSVSGETETHFEMRHDASAGADIHLGTA